MGARVVIQEGHSTKIVVISGSREWPKDDRHPTSDAFRSAICDRLWAYPPETVFLHGACPYGGVDAFAHDILTHKGYSVIACPALPKANGGKSSFTLRNLWMVKTAMMVAGSFGYVPFGELFPCPKSRGTWNTCKHLKSHDVAFEVTKPGGG